MRGTRGRKKRGLAKQQTAKKGKRSCSLCRRLRPRKEVGCPSPEEKGKSNGAEHGLGRERKVSCLGEEKVIFVLKKGKKKKES